MTNVNLVVIVVVVQRHVVHVCRDGASIRGGATKQWRNEGCRKVGQLYDRVGPSIGNPQDDILIVIPNVGFEVLVRRQVLFMLLWFFMARSSSTNRFQDGPWQPSQTEQQLEYE